MEKWEKGDSDEADIRERKQRDLTETENETSKASSSAAGLLIVGRSRGKAHEKRERWATVA